MEYTSNTQPDIRDEYAEYELKIIYGITGSNHGMTQSALARVVNCVRSCCPMFDILHIGYKVYTRLMFECVISFSGAMPVASAAHWILQLASALYDMNIEEDCDVDIYNPHTARRTYIVSRDKDFENDCIKTPDEAVCKWAYVRNGELTAAEQADMFCRMFRNSTEHPYGVSDTFVVSHPDKCIKRMSTTLPTLITSLSKHGRRVTIPESVPEPGEYAVCCVCGKSPYHDGAETYNIMVYTGFNHFDKGIITCYAEMLDICVYPDEFEDAASILMDESDFDAEYAVDRLAEFTGLPRSEAHHYIVQAVERTLKDM